MVRKEENNMIITTCDKQCDNCKFNVIEVTEDYDVIETCIAGLYCDIQIVDNVVIPF